MEAKCIIFLNQKGGVAKTTSTLYTLHGGVEALLVDAKVYLWVCAIHVIPPCCYIRIYVLL